MNPFLIYRQAGIGKPENVWPHARMDFLLRQMAENSGRAVPARRASGVEAQVVPHTLQHRGKGAFPIAVATITLPSRAIILRTSDMAWHAEMAYASNICMN
jgi:hypothetical protein